jgi:transposase
MPVKQVAMRKIKECLRMKWSCGLSHEKIAKALGLSKGVVSKYAQLAVAAGLDWERVSSLDETELQHLLIPSAKRTRGTRPVPDWAIAHREMHKKGVTLQLLWEEYVNAHAGVDTYRYTQFCNLYHGYAATLKRKRSINHGLVG